jgi:amino acid adenylation domain-containing protein
MNSTYPETLARGAEEALAFWATQLSAAPAPLDLPLDRPRPAVPGSRRMRIPAAVPSAVVERAERLARAEGTEAGSVLLTAFLALLGRAARQSDVAAGVPVGHGFLPVRAGLSGDPSFRELLRQVRDEERQTAAHADVPAEALEDLVKEGRLFRAAFVFGETSASLAGLDLLLAVSPGSAGWTGFLDWDAELFDRPTPARFLAGWNRILAAAVADPERRLSGLPWLSEAERHQVVVEWNDTAMPDPGDVCLHHLTEAAARRSPEAVAWIGGRESLTWGELDRRANQLAHHLRRLGVGPEVLVGVFLQRSLPLIVALTAIHKAGGAYVPLDPDYPAERLAFMVEDSGARVLITQRELLPLVAEKDLRTIVLDPTFEVLAGEPEDRPAVEVSPDNVAYLIYTSGSTGRPKGVAIRHRGGVVLMRWATEVFKPSDAAGVLFSTSICFDVSIFELFLPSILGTTGILARHALGLMDVPDPEQVTLVSTAPSGMAELVRLMPIPATVGTVALAGEALPSRLVEDLYRIPSVQRVCNLYGPTEDTTYSTFSLVPRDLVGAPTIGRPLGGGRVHLLDADLQPALLGSRGEILLGGEGLARGYFGRPELTAERFVPDPFGLEPGARLYRTGDLGRYRTDGEIEYLGRIDQQVKIRGLRIEPGEIEAVLARCPGVAEAAVVVQQRRTGPQLVAFYAAGEGQNLVAGRLRRLLQDELPSYMVPARFVALERLPVTPNGKIDRRLLASLPSGDEGESELVPPRNRLEVELRQVWEEVLQIAPISVADNFFSLGGNSLLAIYLMICIRERFGRDLPAAVLLQASTIEQLARVLEKESPELGHPSLVPLQRQGGKTPFFCIHDGAGGTIFRLVELARVLGEADPERPFWGLQAKGVMGEGEPLESIEEMADHYIEAIRTLQPEGPYHLGGYAMGGVIAYEMALRLLDRGERVGMLAMIDAPPRPAGRLPAVDLGRLTFMLARDLALPVALEDLAGLTPDEALARVVEVGIRARRMPREFSFQDARRYLRLMETIMAATRRYRIERVFPGTLTVFEGHVLTEGLDGSWEEMPVRLRKIPVTGNHRVMFERPQVEDLAAALRDALDGAGATGLE